MRKPNSIGKWGLYFVEIEDLGADYQMWPDWLGDIYIRCIRPGDTPVQEMRIGAQALQEMARIMREREHPTTKVIREGDHQEEINDD